MIKPGRVLFVGDEVLKLIALAAGVDYYLFNGSCRDASEWLRNNIAGYDIIACMDSVVRECKEIGRLLESYVREKLVIVLESPLEKALPDPKEYYRRLVHKVLGVEVSL